MAKKPPKPPINSFEDLVVRLEAMESAFADYVLNWAVPRFQAIEELTAETARQVYPSRIKEVMEQVMNTGLPLDTLTAGATALRDWCEVITPLYIAQMRAQGGPTPSEIADARAFSDEVAEKGDVLIFHTSPDLSAKEREDVRRLRGKLARTLAVMAFFPGGIKWLGMTFRAEAPASGG